MRREDASLSAEPDSKVSSKDALEYLKAIAEETSVSIDERIKEVSKRANWYPPEYLEYLKSLKKQSMSTGAANDDGATRNRSAP